jgi:hypothetical protein
VGSEPGKSCDPEAVELSRDEYRELLAFEINCAQLVPAKDDGLLAATVRQYGLSAESVAFLAKPQLTREDVWDLQVLKRRSQKNGTALEAIAKLRAMECALGSSLLRSLMERGRAQGLARK